MKKHSVAVILILAAVYFAVGYLLGVIIGCIFGIAPEDFNWLAAITIPLFMMWYVDLTNLIMFPFAKKTMEKALNDQNFGKTITHVNEGAYTFKNILCIEEETGRVVYVSVTNPFRAQTAHAKDFSKIRYKFDRGPFGGTRFVFFEFYYGNTAFCFTTFRSPKSYWELSSPRVREAITTAENICNLLLKFNPGGNDFSIDYSLPFSKTGLAGFILSFVSVFVAVAAVCCEYFTKYVNGNAIPAYVLVFAGMVLSGIGLGLGIKVLAGAAKNPVRGLGFAKTAVVMSSIVLAISLLSLILFIFV